MGFHPPLPLLWAVPKSDAYESATMKEQILTLYLGIFSIAKLFFTIMAEQKACDFIILITVRMGFCAAYCV